MDHPVRVAWCNILFAVNGGQFTPRGLPIVGQEDVRGYCDRGFDCGSCPFLVQWINAQVAAGWSIGWECSYCLKGSGEQVREGRLVITGHYQAGRDPSLQSDHEDFDPDQPGLSGCTHCGWQTSFLQLVLWR